MAKSLQDLMGYVPLCGLIQATTPGIPDVLPPGFKNIKKTVICDSARYTKLFGNRQTARFGVYGSPGQNIAMAELDVVDVKLFHTIETLQLDQKTFRSLRSNLDYERDAAYEQVAYQIKYAKQRYDNLRIGTTISGLINGTIYRNANGDLLPTSSGSVSYLNYDYKFDANNQNQINGIISAPWTNQNTDIPGQIRKLQQQALKKTGYRLKYAFYGVDVPSMLTNNSYVVEYMARNQIKNNEFLEDAELPNLFGLTWIPIYEGFFNDANGVDQTLMPANKVVFTPEVSSDWFEMLEGTYAVPTTVNIQTDAEVAMKSMKDIPGMFSFGWMTPPGNTINQTMGDTMFPNIKVQNAVFQAVVSGF